MSRERGRAQVVGAMLALALAQACGSAPAQPDTAADEAVASDGTTNAPDRTEGDHATGDRAGDVPRCPERFGLATATCQGGDDPGVCTYPEGTCSCQVPVWCGGAAPPPMPPQWICEQPRPACPTPGTPCTGTGSCSLGPCGFDQIVCADGVWTPRIGPRPP